MVQVGWTRRALADLAAIRAYIHQSRPLAAQRMAQRLKTAGDSLGDHPERGRTTGSAGVRELVVIAPYVIRYQVTADAVLIMRIKHGAQRPDE